MGIVDQTLALVVAAALTSCGGSPFQQGSPAGSDLAGAAGAAGAVSIGTGGSSMLSGAAGVGGHVLSAGSGGTGGELEPASAGAGGEPEPVSTPCDRSSWSATASIPAAAALAIDKMPTTRWTTNVPREPGQWFQLDLGTPTRLVSLELHTELYPLDSPSLVRVDINGKPASFKPSAPVPGALLLEFESSELVQIVRIVASDQGALVPQFDNKPAWWSIYELDAACR